MRFLPKGRGVAGRLDGSLRFPDVGLCLDSEMTKAKKILFLIKLPLNCLTLWCFIAVSYVSVL